MYLYRLGWIEYSQSVKVSQSWKGKIMLAFRTFFHQTILLPL